MKLLFEERLSTIGSDPRTWLRSLGVVAGMRLADLGAGKGLYTLAAAELAGSEGLVYSLEPDASRAALIERRAQSAGLKNVRVLQTGVEKMAGVPDSSVDFALSRNSLHHFSDKRAAFAEVKRVLKLGGTMYIRDILKNRLSMHGTRRDELPSLGTFGFSEFQLRVSGWMIEATLKK